MYESDGDEAPLAGLEGSATSSDVSGQFLTPGSTLQTPSSHQGSSGQQATAFEEGLGASALNLSASTVATPSFVLPSRIADYTLTKTEGGIDDLAQNGPSFTPGSLWHTHTFTASPGSCAEL